MHYQEQLPGPYFSKYVECYWQLTVAPEEVVHQHEVLAPDCTFDILFALHPVRIHFMNTQYRLTIPAGASFIGQKTSGIQLSLTRPTTLYGIRFKPFAFASFPGVDIGKLLNKAFSLSKLFNLGPDNQQIITTILFNREFEEKVRFSEQLIYILLREKDQIDETFRSQLNYILDRKGMIKIKELFTEFGVSKVTLNHHFSKKLGLSPKKVSRIWRLNYFLQLQKEGLYNNLTELCHECGYYDQAHFIHEFKAFFNHSPKWFFKERSQLLSISQEIIAKRFTNQYDPVD